MVQDIYADGIGNVHVTGNMVRFDLISLQPNLKSDNGQPVFDLNHRVIMPLEGFVQAFNLQETLVKQLLQSGVLKNQPNPPVQMSAVQDNKMGKNQEE